jgi:hypothetical protein
MKRIATCLLFGIVLAGTAYAHNMQTTLTPGQLRERCEAAGGTFVDGAGNVYECTMDTQDGVTHHITCVDLPDLGYMDCSWYRKSPKVTKLLRGLSVIRNDASRPGSSGNGHDGGKSPDVK